MFTSELTGTSSTYNQTRTPTYVPNTSVQSGGFDQVLQSAQLSLTDSELLLQRPASPREKPSLKEFMEATGTDVDTAIDLVYGTMGSSDDYRNWSAIMASSDPLQSARQATAAQYDSALPYAAPGTQTFANQATTVAKTSNLVMVASNETKTTDVFLTSTEGKLLRWLHPDTASMEENLTNFGFDSGQAVELLQQYKPSAKSLLQEKQSTTTNATQPAIGIDVAAFLQAAFASAATLPDAQTELKALTRTV